VNPHVSLAVSVENPTGAATNWLPLGSATSLAQRGIGSSGANALHQRVTMTMKFIPARNRRVLELLESVTMPDGRAINILRRCPERLNDSGRSLWLIETE
jgi:hypothetical protein